MISILEIYTVQKRNPKLMAHGCLMDGPCIKMFCYHIPDLKSGIFFDIRSPRLLTFPCKNMNILQQLYAAVQQLALSMRHGPFIKTQPPKPLFTFTPSSFIHPYYPVGTQDCECETLVDYKKECGLDTETLQNSGSQNSFFWLKHEC